jgi:glyoxylase-like metal-dependent hydrolase (beta-lactamase superfamily II)
MAAEDWFAVRQVEPGIHLISEPGHVNSWLITGSAEAVLFDTGMGISDIKAVVSRLTDSPLRVVNSHHHFDHIGGNHLFAGGAIHESGAELVQQDIPAEWLEAYMEYVAEMLAQVPALENLDHRYFRLLTADTTPRQLPPEFDPKKWKVVPTAPTELLKDGDTIDLGGGRKLHVWHTPGHTVDGISLYDEKSGGLFGGDTIMAGPIYTHLPTGDPADLARSARRLASELDGQVRTIYCQHILRYSTDSAFLAEVADGAEKVVEGTVKPVRGSDILGGEVAEYWFDRFSITTPWDPILAQ